MFIIGLWILDELKGSNAVQLVPTPAPPSSCDDNMDSDVSGVEIIPKKFIHTGILLRGVKSSQHLLLQVSGRNKQPLILKEWNAVIKKSLHHLLLGKV